MISNCAALIRASPPSLHSGGTSPPIRAADGAVAAAYARTESIRQIHDYHLFMDSQRLQLGNDGGDGPEKAQFLDIAHDQNTNRSRYPLRRLRHAALAGVARELP